MAGLARRILQRPSAWPATDASFRKGDLRAVVSVTSFKDDNDAIQIANDTLRAGRRGHTGAGTATLPTAPDARQSREASGPTAITDLAAASIHSLVSSIHE